MLKIYASIDLMNGRVVRLMKGSENHVRTYPNSPEWYAEKWSRTGFHGIHVIDLDATFGKRRNLTSIDAIIQSSTIPVQVGGGVRSLETVEKLLKLGVSRIIIGSLAHSLEINMDLIDSS